MWKLFLAFVSGFVRSTLKLTSILYEKNSLIPGVRSTALFLLRLIDEKDLMLGWAKLFIREKVIRKKMWNVCAMQLTTLFRELHFTYI